MNEDRKASQSSMLVVGLLAGVGIAATVAVLLRNRAGQPDQILSGAKDTCDRAIKALEERLQKVGLALAG